MSVQATLNEQAIAQLETVSKVIAHSDNAGAMRQHTIQAMLNSRTPFDSMSDEEKEVFETEVLQDFGYKGWIKTDILSVELDYSMSDNKLNPTAVVEAVGADGDSETFYVQLVGNAHRSSLGCWVTTSDSDGDIGIDEYPLFDIDAVIEAAEAYAEETTNPRRCGDYWLINVAGEVWVCTRSDQYINRDHSPYTRDWEEVEYRADSEEEAREWIEAEDE